MILQTLAIAATLGVFTAEPMDDSRIVREGTGEHRQVMDDAELAPFDAGLFGLLTEWSNGDQLATEALQDHVVAIVFWKNDNPASVRAIVPTLKRLELSYARDGLITLAVHGSDGWDGAKERIASGLISNLVAHDAEDEFAKALGADDVPDAFVIDRAGQMRYADIDPRQLPAAVRGLLRETRDEALGAGERRAKAAAEAKAKKLATRQRSRDTSDPDKAEEELPPRPDAQAYASARWPKPTPAKDLYAKDVQGKPLPVPFGKSEKWLTKKLPADGRVIVLDFWATWCGPCIRASPKLDTLQKKYGDDLRVIGVSGQARGSRYPEDEKSVRAFMSKHKVAYSHVNDRTQAVYRSLGIRGIPHVVVLSSDGVVRWQGNPLEPKFAQVVGQVVSQDPWVKARH